MRKNQCVVIRTLVALIIQMGFLYAFLFAKILYSSLPPESLYLISSMQDVTKLRKMLALIFSDLFIFES